MRRFVVPFLFFLAFALVATAQNVVPEIWGQRVHDETKTLSASSIDQFEKELKIYEDSTTNQIGVLIIQSLNGESIEDYGIRVADKWKLGTKKNDNGVIIIVAVDDHKVRIEVGDGLEGSLTDAVCGRIIRDEMAPNFRRNDYEAGIQAGLIGVVKSIAGEYKVTDPAGNNEMGFWEKFFTGLFIFGLLAIFTGSSLFATGCSGWGVYVFLIPFYAVFPWVVIGVLAAKILFGIYLIGFPIAKIIIGRSKWGKRQIKEWAQIKTSSSGRSYGGGFGLGGFLSGGGGGFSGGGGSFGGGGASGGW